jgi:hypothetical protein
MTSYNEIKAVNWSLLKHYFKSPLHVKYAMEHPREDTEAMSLGSLLHLAILEPHKLKDVHSYERLDWRTKEGRIQRAEIEGLQAAGVMCVSRKEFESVKGMADAVFAQPSAKKIVGAVSETEKVLQAEVAGVKCKGLADFYSEKGKFIGDFKTTSKDPRFFGFQKEAANYHYFGQAAFYMRLCKAMGLEVDTFFWIVIESEAPHGVCIHRLSDVTQSSCDIAIDRFLGWHLHFTTTERWRGYDDVIQTLDCPDWYFKKMEALQ